MNAPLTVPLTIPQTNPRDPRGDFQGIECAHCLGLHRSSECGYTSHEAAVVLSARCRLLRRPDAVVSRLGDPFRACRCQRGCCQTCMAAIAPEVQAAEVSPDTWKTIRATILKRDGYTCRRCLTKRALTVHHIRPRAQGGTNEARNLLTLCSPCHDWAEAKTDDTGPLSWADLTRRPDGQGSDDDSTQGLRNDPGILGVSELSDFEGAHEGPTGAPMNKTLRRPGRPKKPPAVLAENARRYARAYRARQRQGLAAQAVV